MNDLKATFEKQGKWKLIRQYWKNGTLFTAIIEFLLLGTSRTALEILRLATYLKVKRKLQKKYLSELDFYDKNYSQNLPHKSNKKIWVCWFQGIENAPKLVQKCFHSLEKYLSDYELVLITSENIEEYVHFPDFILEKWKKGQITDTHMTDLLRLELLIEYGGVWIDATVLCTSREIPKYFFDSDLFFYQCLKPGRDGHSHVNSSWFICAKTNNKVLMATRYLCYEYWKTHNSLVDYFLLHDFMAIVLDYYAEDWKRITPCCNSTPHILLLRLFEQYDEEMFNNIKSQTPFHKLTYKFTPNQVKMKNTYYEKLFK